MAANKLTTWAEVDAFVATRGLPATDLPAQPISVMVPPLTSGTRDAMGALFMKNGFKQLKIEGDGYKNLAEDGLAIEGENDALIVEKRLLIRICWVSSVIPSLTRTAIRFRPRSWTASS